jgi:uncharacterized protein (DUF983 family)
LPRTKFHHPVTPPSLSAAMIQGLCPRCGAQTVFDVGAQFHSRCAKCGMNFERFEASGRFAALITLLLVIVLVGAALLVDEIFELKLWIELAIWVPITILAVLYGVRSAKAGWLMLRYLKRQQVEREKGDHHG